MKDWSGRQSKTGAARAGRPIIVRALSPHATHGLLQFGNLNFRCALGRGGRKTSKREGDGATPVGRWGLREIYYRADRLLPPRSGLSKRNIRPGDGWCDASGDRNYNRRVQLPYGESAENLHREDGVYDIVVVLDYNIRPRMRGAGSAIFMHLARPGYPPTAGCVALNMRDLKLLLERSGRVTEIVVPG